MKVPSWVTWGLSQELKEKAEHLPKPYWYMFIYLRLGGMPFTYQIRAWGRKHPALAMLAICILAYIGYRLLADTTILGGYVVTAITFGLAAHVFWGSKRTK